MNGSVVASYLVDRVALALMAAAKKRGA